MKKIIALVIAALMILSMIPVVTLSASAANEGDWITKRRPGQSEEELKEKGEDKYQPAPGYHYDSEGFHTDSPNYKDITPHAIVRTREAYNLQDGMHLEFRVDAFEYKGTDPDTGASLGKDEWICVSFFPGPDMAPGSTEYGSGWLCLIRGVGDGTATVQPHWTTGRNEDGTGGTFAAAGAFPNVDVPLDDEGKELYTVDVAWDGNAYTISVNGTALAGGDKLPAVIPDGMCYVTITTQTSLLKNDQILEMSILDWNGSVPTGSDSADPDENVNSFADMTPSDSIPAGQPCFSWDGNCTCFRKLPETGHDCNIAGKGDGTVHITATGSGIYFTAGPSASYSYEAKDFPVMGLLLRNYNGGDGQLWYAAGDIVGAQDDAVINWSLWDDGCEEYEVGDDLYNLVVLDVRDYDEERWVGRIHGGQRLVFGGLTPDDEDFGEFDICYFAFFRSIEDAQNYAKDYVGNKGEIKTEAPTEAPTEKPTEAPTEAKSEVATTAGEAGTGAATEAVTKAEKSGCKSVIGGSVALILTAAAAAVALKKKH